MNIEETAIEYASKIEQDNECLQTAIKDAFIDGARYGSELIANEALKWFSEWFDKMRNQGQLHCFFNWWYEEFMEYLKNKI